MPVNPSNLYVFGAFRLNRADRQLVREGTVVPLASKAMDVLLILVENSGRVIERAELLKRVWPDSEGADGSLAVTVSALRKTLGDRPDGGPFIETVPRQGYRFAAGVTAPLEEVMSPSMVSAEWGRGPGLESEDPGDEGVGDPPTAGAFEATRASRESGDRVHGRGHRGQTEVTSAVPRDTHSLS